MVIRQLKPLKNHSFFLFGARGTGKTTFIQKAFSNALFFDLLDPKLADAFMLDPDLFHRQLSLKENLKKVVVIDEVQRLPKLLDIVHQLSSKEKRQFVLTGSSARRLKQAGVNLLAGRAYVYHLFPFSSKELSQEFNLSQALNRGLLPDAYLAESEEHAREYLKSYIFTYLEKEIQFEQWVRKLEPFRRFLETAAQMSGKVINRSSIAKDVGVDQTTIASYYEILEDTLLGFHLPAFHESVRKSQKVTPKFYLFDNGVKRALDRTLSSTLLPKTSAFGEAFEHFIITEIMKRASYKRLDWRYSYLRTKDDVELDLIIDRPGKPRMFIEIKSKDKISESDAKALETLGKDTDSKASRYLLSLDTKKQLIGATLAMHWSEGLDKILGD